MPFRTLKIYENFEGKNGKVMDSWCACTFSVIRNVPRNKMGMFLHVLSEQHKTEHLDPMFPRTLPESQESI